MWILSSIGRNLIGGTVGGIAVCWLFAGMGYVFMPGFASWSHLSTLPLTLAVVGALMGGGLGLIGFFDDMACGGAND